ncbi:DUF2334 domain-containing protein [Candidatus Thorarchaeota archaeon]|nr:MAG: DUF2334 domain-containing protein [Candidatus Thorarchaeota archaeon]
MLKLHRTPFEELLRSIFDALDPFDASFAFPTVAAVASMRPDLVKWIVQEGHEVASHGYNHVRYPHLTPEEQECDLVRSLKTFRGMGISVRGFRAPYDNYTDDMPKLLEKYDIIWDGGFGYRPEHREKDHFFRVELDGRPSKVTYIPLSIWSDDRMIDTLGMKPPQVTRQLRHEISAAKKTGGVLMFDLHPIRIGQNDYVDCLREIAAFADELGAWIPTPHEAVTYWNKHGRWKGDAKFCLLLTGDIDNWVFSDYLRREIWRWIG